ncbi:hypothetical protein QJQ45_006678 [Haematococcus lacustris]|nr:hypothetical protein QJQ45_006678 [Haematococcus lacustris]
MPDLHAHAERFVRLYAKAARARLGWSGEEAQLFIKMACGYGINAQSSELQAANLDKTHVDDLIEEADKHRRLLGMKKQGFLQDTLPLPCRMRHAVYVCRWLEQWQQPPTPPVPGQPKRGKRASGSGQQEVVGERRQVIKAAIRGLVEAARPDLSPTQVDAVVAEMNKRMTMGSKQCCLTAVMSLTMLLQSFLGQPTEGFPAAGPAPGHPPPPDPACPPYTHPRLATHSSPRSAAAPAQLPPPVPLNIEDPKLLAQIKDAMELMTTARQYYWAYDTRYRALQVGSVAAAHDELAAPGSHNPPDFCHNLNCPDFEVLKDYGNGVQLRRYAPSTWAVTDVNETLYEKASAVGFQRLFKYILGNNNLEAKIDMTAPVVTEVNLDADDEFTDQYSVAFYLPWEYQAVVDEDGKKPKPSEVPGPKDDRVVIEDEPRADVYVLPFGSYALGFRVKKLAIDFFDFLVVNGMKWVSRQHYHQERGVAVFLGAGCFSRGGWKSKAVREGFCKVVEQPSRPSTVPRLDRLVIVDEFPTSRVSSSVHARQPCELHLPDDRPRPEGWIPPAGQVNQRLVRPAWSLRHAKWLDRDTNACLNFQRIGESKQRPLELCRWHDLEAQPPLGKEYQQGYKRVNDRLPKEVGSVAAADDELAAPGSHNPPDFCHNLNCPDFEVLKDYGNGVQLRRYVPSMWAMTDVNETLYEKASAAGFQRLSRYILGNNNLEAKIEQTTPVVTEVYLNMDDEFTEQYLVAFYLPWKYQPAVNKDNKQAKVPEPKDDRVIIADEPRALVYVLPFGSYAQGSKVKKLAIDFYDFLDQQGITNYERSTFMVAVYDKPYKPFNRHNEIWVLTCQALLSAMSADGEDMEAIEQFCLITGKDQGVAKEWLSLSENNVERAIGLFFENGPSVPPQRASSGPVDMTEEDAAAAAAAMQDVEEYGDLHVAGTTAPTSVAGTRRTSSSVLDDDEEDEAAMMRTMAHNRAAGREAAQEAERAIEGMLPGTLLPPPLLPPGMLPPGLGVSGLPDRLATMDDDEALARRLMEEEERGLQGVGQGSHGPYHTLPSRAPRQGAAGASQLGRLGLEPEGLGGGRGGGGRGGVRGASLLHPQGPGAGGRQGEGQGEEEEEEEEEEHTALGVGRQELEEARMIEAAMLGLPYEPRLPLRGRSAGGRQAGARGGPPLGDPDLHDGRSLRWEQDQAYEESLAADKAKADSSAEAAREAAAAARRLAEEAAAAERAAAEAAAKLKATLARKAAALVPEPAPGIESSLKHHSLNVIPDSGPGPDPGPDPCPDPCLQACLALGIAVG